MRPLAFASALLTMASTKFPGEIKTASKDSLVALQLEVFSSWGFLVTKSACKALAVIPSSLKSGSKSVASASPRVPDAPSFFWLALANGKRQSCRLERSYKFRMHVLSSARTKHKSLTFTSTLSDNT